MNRSSNGPVWLALPDGHQQPHTQKFLEAAGLKLPQYSNPPRTRRFPLDFEGIMVKVVRPQDMPAHVAGGHFDIGITGQDWLQDHKFRFPGSPVYPAVDALGFGNVRLCAVVHNDVPVETVPDLIQRLYEGGMPKPYLRIASEYTALAEQFALKHHLTRYRIIPTWGSTEAFLPEDADMILENSETGRTLRENNLKIIEIVSRSCACVVACETSLEDPVRRKAIEAFTRLCRNTLEKTTSPS